MDRDKVWVPEAEVFATSSATCFSTSSFPFDDTPLRPSPARKVLVRLTLKCKYCGVLQLVNKVKCQSCGAPYDEAQWEV